MTEGTGYRANHATADYEDEQTKRARWAMEQLHGTGNAAVKGENDAQELLTRCQAIMEAATHMADTLYQGNPEMGPLMTQELGRMEQTLAHRVVQQYPAADLTKAHSHTTPLTPPPWRKRVWHSQRVLASNQVEPERRRPEVHAGHFTWGSNSSNGRII